MQTEHGRWKKASFEAGLEHKSELIALPEAWVVLEFGMDMT